MASRGQLSSEIYRQLRGAIRDGRLRSGDRLPPSRELAANLKVARMTVTAAYERLSGEGYVISRVGAGTFVSAHFAVPESRKIRTPEGPLRPRPIWEAISSSAPLSRPAFARPARFDFRSGLPDASLFPHQTWRRLVARELRATAIGTGAYGDPAGHLALREAIARHIAVSRGVMTAKEDVSITNGTQQALDIVARVLLAPGDCVAVEAPGYTPIRLLLTSGGARVVGVPVDEHGLIVDALPKQARLVCVTPSHQYPLGVSMSLERRLALLAWAEEHGAAIVEDDYDTEFRFRDRPIEPLHAVDRTGRVIYVGSFSKTMLPSLRLGFLVTPSSLRGAVRAAKFITDWHTSLPLQAALSHFIDDGHLARHIRRMHPIYEARHRLITDILSRDFSEQLEPIPSVAGLHLAAFSRTLSERDLLQAVHRSSRVGVEVQELSRFAVDGVRTSPGLVLGYGATATNRIEEGLRLLRWAMNPSGGRRVRGRCA